MAKKKKGGYGEGKSSKELISSVSHSIGRMKEATLRQAVTRLSSAMNKRLDRAAKAGETSPAIEEVMRSGGRFSAKGKTHEELKAEFIRLKNFYQSPTSTRKGWQKVQREATKQARDEGLLPPPPTPVPVDGGVSGAPDVVGDLRDILGSEPEDVEGWTPPDDQWEWDEEHRYWKHPIYGEGWLPYEVPGGGMIDPITGEIVGNQVRSIHDYDATLDDRRWGEGTEAGELWRMVDSVAKMDPRFRQRDDSDPDTDPRMRLFAAIDDAWASNDAWSFEEARDSVLSRLDEIYEEADRMLTGAESRGGSIFEDLPDFW